LQKELVRLQEKITKLQKENEELGSEVQAALEKDKFISERDARIAALEKRMEEGENVQHNWSQTQGALRDDLQKKEKQILSLTKVHQKFDNKSLNDQN
jgi:predicted RNase H-like nuclease (RuvC/YqgF family)